ncbi:hypothetical protein BDP55DRAFT_654706 [Colletotrichum godetiae]|uniref:Uncharacterized protein n=1 Tax=Colletotrichum godetiae TaxID=1209918 RepID=A0AAJ0AT11_9PEZI|nr:uncharacterized protein BDP55DRAFT_654706 [Colletotrichum godetiae]KAK1689243.1 hypothetical protein BDP55DRAFT_654706 [Colletotrichum godetiae]
MIMRENFSNVRVFNGFRNPRRPPPLTGYLSADIEKNGLGMEPLGDKISNLTSHASGSTSEDISDFKRPAKAILAATLILLGSSVLDLYAILGRGQTDLEKASSDDGGFPVEAHSSDEGWYWMWGDILGANMTSKAIRVLSSSTPAVLILGLVAYGTGASTLYHLNHRDKYRDTMLTGSILLGFCLGIVWEMDGQTILLRILPWTVLVALWLSNAKLRFYET